MFYPDDDPTIVDGGMLRQACRGSPVEYGAWRAVRLVEREA